ncbi:MAG: PilZ domain-containing protein [Fimbriimonadaceae bacterium]
MLLTSFRNARARLQRLTDARFFAGWARDLTPEILVVQFVEEALPNAGDHFHVQIAGNKVAATFGAKLVFIRGHDAQLRLLESPRFIASTEEMRVWAGEARAVVRDGTCEFAVTILDMSLRGIGILLTEPMPSGDDLEVEYASRHGLIKGTAEVRYCRPSAQEFGTYRAGLLWTHMDRVSSARWQKVVEEAKLAA